MQDDDSGELADINETPRFWGFDSSPPCDFTSDGFIKAFILDKKPGC